MLVCSRGEPLEVSFVWSVWHSHNSHSLCKRRNLSALGRKSNIKQADIP